MLDVGHDALGLFSLKCRERCVSLFAEDALNVCPYLVFTSDVKTWVVWKFSAPRQLGGVSTSSIPHWGRHTCCVCFFVWHVAMWQWQLGSRDKGLLAKLFLDAFEGQCLRSSVTRGRVVVELVGVCHGVLPRFCRKTLPLWTTSLKSLCLDNLWRWPERHVSLIT